MLNQVILVGRLTSDPELQVMESGKKVTYVTVAVQRTYKNPDGIYEADFIRCVLWNGIATNTSDYCKRGDVVGVKGRIATRSYDDKEGTRKYVTEVVAEKVTFLSNSKKEIEDKTESQIRN